MCDMPCVACVWWGTQVTERPTKAVAWEMMNNVRKWILEVRVEYYVSIHIKILSCEAILLSRLVAGTPVA